MNTRSKAMDEVLAAAERFRAWSDGENIYNKGDNQRFTDVHALANAYLAEHQADHGETIDIDFATQHMTYQGGNFYTCGSGDCVSWDSEDGSLYFGTRRVRKSNTTRGQLRHFLKAIGGGE